MVWDGWRRRHECDVGARTGGSLAGVGSSPPAPCGVLSPRPERGLTWKQGLRSCNHLRHLPSSPSRFYALCVGPWPRLDASPSGAQLNRLGEGICRMAQSSELLVMRRCAPDLEPKLDIAKDQRRDSKQNPALWSSVFSSTKDSLSSRRLRNLTHG